jgi:hypothetical protein
MNSTDTHKIVHSAVADYPFFLAASSKADHILSLKAIFNKSKKLK